MKKLLQIIMLTVFTTLLAACSNSDEKEIQANASNFIHAVVDGNADTIADLAYLGGRKISDQERAQINAMFAVIGQAIKQEVDKKGGLKSIETKDVKINGDTATATMVIKVGNGGGKSSQIQLHKEDGKWKIDMSQPLR